MTLVTQETYRHGWLIDLLLNNISGRKALLQEREFKLSRSGSSHGDNKSFWLVTSKTVSRRGEQIEIVLIFENVCILCIE